MASPTNSSPRFNQSTSSLPHRHSGGGGGGGDGVPERESSAMDLDRRSDISGAGYSAYSGHRGSEGGVAEPPNYHIRLIKFYQRYNPEKISRVHEFLEAYKGDEEELFRTLVAKYGPEPEPSVVSAASASTGFAQQRGQVGLAHVPKMVSRADGNCDRETPYYPAQRNIMESDLCNLLLTRATTHVDLRAAFVGYLPEHPASAWNGMTYVTNVPVPIDEQSRFLGHLWSGSLSNTKTIVHEKLSYTRTVFHCGESCSNADFPHERWRLTLIRGDHTPDTLYRVLWDPFLSPQAAAELLNKAPGAAEQDRSFFSSLFGRNKKPDQKPPPPPPPPPLPRAGGFSGHSGARSGAAGGAVGGAPPPAYPPPMTSMQPMPLQPTRALVGHAAGAVGAPPGPAGPGGIANGSGAIVTVGAGASSAGAAAAAYHQPQQPHIVSAIDSLVQLVQGLEGRLTERLSDLDKRLQAVENDVVLLKEMSDQRQVEQLPEPWLEEGSSAVGPRASRPGTRSNGGSRRSGGGGGAAAAGSGGPDGGGSDSKERALAQAKARRRQHRRRMEAARERGFNENEEDGTETIRTATSMGTSVGARSSEFN